MAVYRKNIIKKRITAPSFCAVCKRGEPVDWKNIVLLRQFITERGKIIPRSRSGVCAKHQRQLSTHIKRARIAALLPFVER